MDISGFVWTAAHFIIKVGCSENRKSNHIDMEQQTGRIIKSQLFENSKQELSNTMLVGIESACYSAFCYLGLVK